MQKETLTQLGQRIHDLRVACGLSQEQLAEVAAVDRAYISQIETGQRNPSVMVLERIAAALEVPTAELMSAEDDELKRSSQGTLREKREESESERLATERTRLQQDWAADAQKGLNKTIDLLRARGFRVSMDDTGRVSVEPPE